MELSSREKKASAVFIVVAGLAVLGVFSFLTPVNSYEKFRIESIDSDVEHVTAECTCYGSLMVAESYPPQYMCEGYERCTPVNYTRSRR